MKIFVAFLLMCCSGCYGQSINFNLQNVTTLRGHDAVVPCTYEAVGVKEGVIPVIKWISENKKGVRQTLYTFKKGDEGLTAKDTSVQRNLSVTKEGSLEIYNVTLADNDNLRKLICEVDFGQAGSGEGFLYFHVVVLAKQNPVTKLKADVFSVSTEPVPIGSCKSGASYPQATITFYKGSNEIESSDTGESESLDKDGVNDALSEFLTNDVTESNKDETVSFTRTLVAPISKDDDMAQFYCIVTTGGGSKATTLVQNASFPLFRVNHPTTWAKITSNMDNPSVGEDLILTCEANGFPVPDIEIDGLTSATTTITLTKSDNGRIVNCKAGDIRAEPYTIKVLYSEDPVITGETTVDLDDPLELSCKGDSYPTPKYIVWKKDNKIIRNDTAVESMGMLIIKNAQFEDAGKYTCLVQNEFSSLDREKMSQKVIVNGLMMTSTEDELVKGTLEDIVELKCTATSSPKPTFTWNIVSSGDTVEPEPTVEKENMMYESVLKVGPLEPSMSKAIYTCTVKNGEFEQLKKFELPELVDKDDAKEIVGASSATAAIIIVILVIVLIVCIVLAVLYNKGIICKKEEKGDEDAEDIVGTIKKDENPPADDDVEAGKPEEPAEEETRLVNGNGEQ